MRNVVWPMFEAGVLFLFWRNDYPCKVPSLLEYLNLLAFVTSLRMGEHPHVYDNFILANYQTLDNRKTIVVF